MRKYLKLMIIPVFLLSIGTTQQSCKTKEGCGLEELYRNPDMEAKRKDSGLFSKKQTKKMKKKG